MKKKLLFVIVSLLLISGCDFKDDFSDKYVYTTLYPIEYATSILYGEYGNINSVYPNGTNKDYEISEKKKDIYSKSEIFVYSGIAQEAPIARDIINRNNKVYFYNHYTLKKISIKSRLLLIIVRLSGKKLRLIFTL